MKPILKITAFSLSAALLAALAYRFLTASPSDPLAAKAKPAPVDMQQQADQDQWLDRALNKLQKRGLYDTPERRRCLIFDTEILDTDLTEPQSLDLVVRELHDPAKNCAGDPNVAPVLARYRVSLTSDDISFYQPAEDEYQTLSDCDVIEYQAFAEPKPYRAAATEQMRVAQAGRSYFHSAPDPRCKQAQKFVVAGDTLKAEYQFQEFTRVSYTHPKTSAYSYGWILSSALVPASPAEPAAVTP